MEITDNNLRIALEKIDADSWEELCAAVPAEVARTLQLSVGRIGSAVYSRCVVGDAPLTNRVIAMGLGSEATQDQIHTLIDHYRSSGLKNFIFQISPYAGPPALEQWLADAGLVLRNRWVKLVRGNEALEASDSSVDVIEVLPQDKMLFGETSARGFGRPPIIAHFMASTVGFSRWRHYLAYLNGEVAGAACMYIDGDYAWLGIGSTLPDFRQQGVQQALIARRVRDGLTEGVRHFIAETESFNVSCNNLMRHGFVCAYERANYGLPVEPA